MSRLRVELNGTRDDLLERLRRVTDPTHGFFSGSGLGLRDLLMFTDRDQVRVLLRPQPGRSGIALEFHGRIVEVSGKAVLNGAIGPHPCVLWFGRIGLAFVAWLGAIMTLYALIVPTTEAALLCVAGGIGCPLTAFAVWKYVFWLRRDSEVVILTQLRRAFEGEAIVFEVTA